MYFAWKTRRAEIWSENRFFHDFPLRNLQKTRCRSTAVSSMPKSDGSLFFFFFFFCFFFFFFSFSSLPLSLSLSLALSLCLSFSPFFLSLVWCPIVFGPGYSTKLCVLTQKRGERRAANGVSPMNSLIFIEN